MATQRFRIAIKYREPIYELAAGKKAEPYGWSLDVVAPDAVEALRVALAHFEGLQRLSSVGWVREVVRIEIDVLTAPASAGGSATPTR